MFAVATHSLFVQVSPCAGMNDNVLQHINSAFAAAEIDTQLEQAEEYQKIPEEATKRQGNHFSVCLFVWV